MSGEGLNEKSPEFGGNCSREGEVVRDENGGLGTEIDEISRVENDKGMGEFGEELTKKNVELGPVNENRETMQLSSSDKKVNPSSIDRLSDLPDSLLNQILSFHSVKEAAVTSVLSKRWQFLWSDLAKLDFWESNGEHWDSSRDEAKIGRFVSFVNKTIAVRTANNLEKFAVYFQYSKCYESDVDGWVEFVLKSKVKRLSLMLNSFKDYYMLPDSIFSNSPMKSLWIRGCIMTPQRTIEWKSLTQLYLKEVGLNQDVIDGLFLGCPVLDSLYLAGCWGFHRLEVISRRLHRLKVEECDNNSDEPVLEISAPYLHTLDIVMSPEGRKLRVRNIQSLLRACVEFKGNGWEATSLEEAMMIANGFLQSFQLVKEVHLGVKFFEVVSIMAVHNWQLPQSKRRCYRVSSASEHEYGVCGIMGLLESSPNLESLFIMGYDTGSEYVDLDPATRNDLNCDLPKLKTVHIKNYGEPMLFLVPILLKRATALEKMVIVTDVEEDDFDFIRHELLSCPKSSQKAVVSLHRCLGDTL